MDKIDRLLLKVGMPAHVKGCRYTKVALRLLEEDPAYTEMMMKRLYPGIAEKCGTTPGRVERAIRHGVDTTFDRMPPDLQEEIFGNSVSARRGKPGNCEFLACLALHLKEEGGADKI